MSNEIVFSVPATGDPLKDAYTRHELHRAARNAREGTEAALRIFGTIAAETQVPDVLAAKVAEASTRVESGKAPVEFKIAFDASIHDLLSAAL